jgi:hypothetical protein
LFWHLAAHKKNGAREALRPQNEFTPLFARSSLAQARDLTIDKPRHDHGGLLAEHAGAHGVREQPQTCRMRERFHHQ